MRSKFEEDVARKYPELGYETDKLTYVVPAKKRTYNPDWTVREKVYIETKGKLDRETIEKMLLVKEQNPDAKIYLLFQRGTNKLRRGSKMTYLDWAKKMKQECFDVGVPYFFKQIDKVQPIPEDLMIRQFPNQQVK